MLNLVEIKDFLLIAFYFSYAVLLPGYLLTRVIVPPFQLRKLLKTFPSIEKSLVYRYFYYLFAPATGLVLVDSLILVLAKFNQLLSFNNLLVGFLLINLFLLIVNILLTRSPKVKKIEDKKLGVLPIVLILLFIGSVLIRTVFYLPNAVPNDTDLGHHMYWSQLMVKNETFPAYDTPEVIEGEHMLFAVISKLSGVTLLSALPTILLSFYNLVMVLVVSLTAIAVTASRRVGLWTLFFLGIYFAVDPPQARYIKGGVIGNTFGNLMIPLVFLLVFLFLRWFYANISKFNKSKMEDKKIFQPVVSLVSMILVILAGSFYSHHLSTFLLGISLAFSLLVWITITFIWNYSNKISWQNTLKSLTIVLKKLILAPKFIFAVIIIAVFPSFVYLPHYLANDAVKTVTQTPEKDTHLGITLEDFLGKMGWTRFILLAIGIAYLAILVFKTSKISEKFSWIKYIKNKKSYFLLCSIILFLGWFLPLFLLSFSPDTFRVDLPSRRVVNYLVFPSVILVSLAASWLFMELVKINYGRYSKFLIAFFALIILWDGSSDFRSVYTGENKFQDTVELYNASSYLSTHTQPDAVMLKDHRTVSGDSWIKFFLLRGYDGFLSRTYDYKYAVPSNKLDPCAREIIIVPRSNVSQDCYGQTGINYVIVKPAGDEFLFWKDQGFNAVYLNDDIAIFQRDKI